MPRLPKPRFNLKAPKAKSETLIFLVFRYRGKRLLYSTGLSVHPKEWNPKTQRPFTLERRPDLWAIQRQLDDLASWCRSIYIESEYGRISTREFKDRLDEQSGRKEPEETSRLTFLEFVEKEIAEMEGQGMRKSSLAPYKVHAGVLKAFAEEQGVFTFEEVDWNFRLKLIDWLAEREVMASHGKSCKKACAHTA